MWNSVLELLTLGEVEGFAQERKNRAQVRGGADQGDVRDAVAAWPDFGEVRRAHLAAEVNHHAQRIAHHGQVREDACRPEQRVPVAGHYLDASEALYGGFECAVESGKRRRPIFEQRSSAAESAGVTLIRLTKGTRTPSTDPSHEVLPTPRRGREQGLELGGQRAEPEDKNGGNAGLLAGTSRLRAAERWPIMVDLAEGETGGCND
jgi:hypothetical protein